MSGMTEETCQHLAKALAQSDRRRARREAWRAYGLDILTGACIAPLTGWFLMLAIGVAHQHWWPAVPTIGYGWAVLLSVLLPVWTAGRKLVS